ncbi:hypothetical protein CIPAW_02G174500 [Carya illinoinensis]|uniref:Uncharacterized protein n=1 Tax=Carya illinoinensis TaxID=32201 RepID=A0A8T1RIG2_CARIL|nr:hypothetical protein CIPAW_02G174500 [Carya illinoinensis]
MAYEEPCIFHRIADRSKSLNLRLSHVASFQEIINQFTTHVTRFL